MARVDAIDGIEVDVTFHLVRDHWPDFARGDVR